LKDKLGVDGSNLDIPVSSRVEGWEGISQQRTGNATNFCTLQKDKDIFRRGSTKSEKSLSKLRECEWQDVLQMASYVTDGHKMLR
jgi:hypothetical protein